MRNIESRSGLKDQKLAATALIVAALEVTGTTLAWGQGAAEGDIALPQTRRDAGKELAMKITEPFTFAAVGDIIVRQQFLILHLDRVVRVRNGNLDASGLGHEIGRGSQLIRGEQDANKSRNNISHTAKIASGSGESSREKPRVKKPKNSLALISY